jgi:hypothetical protein
VAVLGKEGPEGSGTNTIERAGKGGGNSDSGWMDNFVARGKLPAGLKHRLDLQQLRVVACCGISFNFCESKPFKDFITLLRPKYTPASKSAVRLTNTRADFEISLILISSSAQVFAGMPVFVG